MPGFYYLSPRAEIYTCYEDEILNRPRGIPLARTLTRAKCIHLWMGRDWSFVWSPIEIDHPDVALITTTRAGIILPSARSALGPIADGRNTAVRFVDFVVDLIADPPAGVGRWPGFRVGASGYRDIRLGPPADLILYREFVGRVKHSIAYEDTFDRSNRSMNGDTSSDGNFTWSDVSGFTGGGDIVSNAAQFDDVATANSAAIASISTASDDIYVEGPFDANVSGYNSLESHFYLSANSTLTEGNIGKLSRHSYLPQYRGRQLVDIATGDVLDEDGTDDPSGTCRVEVSGTGIDMFIDGSGTATLSGTVEETQNSSHRREALGSWCYHSGHPDPVIFGSYLYGDLGGGTTYEQSAAGSLTPAGAEARETQKKAAGSITPAGAQNRTIFILRGGSLTPIGGTSKETQKPLAGSFTPTGALATVMIFLQTALGALVPTGLLSKQTQKPFSGSLTPAASIQRLTAKRFLGTVTPMGSESRETHKVLAGLLTPAGALDSLLSVFRTVTGALSPVGALSKLIEKIVGAAALVSSGTISRQTEKGPFTGALGLSGTTTKMTQRAVTGTITPSGTLIPAPIFAQSMSGVLVPSGAITTQLLGSPGAHDIAVLNQALWKMHHHIDNLG